MRRILFVIVALIAGAAIILLLPQRQQASSLSLHPHGIHRLIVTSPAFKAGARMPARFTADGTDISPPLKWSHVPAGVKSFVVIIEDTDAPGVKAFTHWVIWNIGAAVRSLPAGIKAVLRPPVPADSRQGRNSFGKIGFGGPAPPPGKPHHYHILVYALSHKLSIPAGTSAHTVILAMEKHLLAWGHLTVLYGR